MKKLTHIFFSLASFIAVISICYFIGFLVRYNQGLFTVIDEHKKILTIMDIITASVSLLPLIFGIIVARREKAYLVVALFNVLYISFAIASFLVVRAI